MPEILPFTPYYYARGRNNDKFIKDGLSKVIAPPYDVISKYQKSRLIKDKYNITHIILPETYDKASFFLNKWIEKRILINNAEKAIYIYGIEFTINDCSERIKRYGIVALLKLTEFFDNGDVLPHEMTFPKYTEDRYKLITKTDSNFSPIFTIYDGNGFSNEIIEKYIKNEPFLETIDSDNFNHKIWVIENQNDIKYLQKKFLNTPIIIADGHHRYITALKRSRHGGCKYIMAMFIDFHDPGLKIYTSYRLIKHMPIEIIKRMNPFFEIQYVNTFDELERIINLENQNRLFGLSFKGKFFIFSLKENFKPEEHIHEQKSVKWKNLPVPILHHIIFEKCLKIPKNEIIFKKNLTGVNRLLKRGKFEAIFMVSNTKLEDIKKITAQGEIMPQKSTYFFPKPLSGLLIHKHKAE
jgi:uncharacterized protein (DUF1015 family)